MTLCRITILFICFLPLSLAEKRPIKAYTVGKSQIYVFDDTISESLGNVFLEYVAKSFGFSYLYPDPYENCFGSSEGNIFWKSVISPNLLIKTKMWKAIRNTYKSLPEVIHQGKRFLPYDVNAFFLTRGDVPIPFQAQPKEDGEIFVRIFLSRNYDKNSYSDQTFYTEDGEEIAFSVHPKPNRIIMWTGSVETLFRPPSMGQKDPLYGLFIKLTSDLEIFKQAASEFEIEKEKKEKQTKQPLPFKNQLNKLNFDTVNPGEHLVGKYYDKDGNAIAFFDNILPKVMVDAIRSHYVRYGGTLMAQNFDVAAAEDHDNVQFIYQYEPETVFNTPYLAIAAKLASYLSNQTGWQAYDVSCNLIQHVHHTRIHIDCTNREFEYTFLLYLNPNWDADMYAETSFYDYADLQSTEELQNEKTWQLGNQSYEFIAAAVPKFGRIAVFRNLIPHSARPPAPSFLAARYTFPIKVSESSEQARAKMLHESLDFKHPDTPDNVDYESLREGFYEKFLKEDRQEWVQKHLALMRRDKLKSIKERIDYLEKQLIPAKYRAEKLKETL